MAPAHLRVAQRRVHHPLRVMRARGARRTLTRIMEWVALTVWLVVVMLALPVAGGVLSGAPALGVQAAAAIGGLVFCVLFILKDGPTWAGWATFAMACVAVVACARGADVLLSEERQVTGDLQGVEEVEATLLGFELPILGVALLCSLCLGVHLVTLR
jgi:hypothetical protein